MMSSDDDDDVYYYMRWSLKLEGETENMGVCTKERKGVTAAVLMATPCTNSLGGESGGQKHEGCGGHPPQEIFGGRSKKEKQILCKRASSGLLASPRTARRHGQRCTERDGNRPGPG